MWVSPFVFSDNQDPIPTVPAGTVQTIVELKAMNENADTVITSLFGSGSEAQHALMRCDAEGDTRLIARSDQFPGVPGTTDVSLSGPDFINDNGDVLATVQFEDARGTSNFALYAHLAPRTNSCASWGRATSWTGWS